MKTYSKSILATIVVTGAIALCSLNVNAATISGTTTHVAMQSDTTKMKKDKMKMDKMKMKKMAKMKKDKMKMDKMKMDKMQDTTKM